MNLPNWMYHQIINDSKPLAVWCFCGKPAITYCNGLQFVCDGSGHFGVPMVQLKRRREQKFLEQQCANARKRQATEKEDLK